MDESTRNTKNSKPIKCIVWDLDNTIWEGVLLEDGDGVRLREDVVDVICRADRVGVLHSIASRNEEQVAAAHLESLRLSEYFVYPQINWSPKSVSVARIATDLNLAINSFAFVDDDPFERDEVHAAHPEVRCFDSQEPSLLWEMLGLDDLVVSSESRARRSLYQAEGRRKVAEQQFEGSSDAFLSTLGLEMSIWPARPEDLRRAEELTLRTSQLNSTGVTYSEDELRALCNSDDYKVLMARLVDHYGDYGKIGLAVVELAEDVWTLRLLLTSCRVISRGAGTILLNHVMREARDAGVRLRAHFTKTQRNRIMFVGYRFAGFRVVDRDGDLLFLESDLKAIQDVPPYLQLRIG